jgi:hypothetical protein
MATTESLVPHKTHVVVCWFGSVEKVERLYVVSRKCLE